MTRFEKDYRDAKSGNAIEVITRRRAELEKLTAEGHACKNAFRRQCLAQEVVRLTAELKAIENLF